MLATPGEYALVTIKAYDVNGNPKPNVTFRVSEEGGVTLSATSVTTDDFGYATLYIDADTNSLSGLVEVVGSQDTVFGNFDVLWNADQGTDATIPSLGTETSVDLANSGLLKIESPSAWLPDEEGSLVTNVNIPACEKIEFWMRVTLESAAKTQVLGGIVNASGTWDGWRAERNSSGEIYVNYGAGGGAFVNDGLGPVAPNFSGERFWLRVVTDTNGTSTISEHRDQPSKPADDSGGWVVLDSVDTSSLAAITSPATPNDNIIIGAAGGNTATLVTSGIHAWELRADGQLLTAMTSTDLGVVERGAQSFQDSAGATITLESNGAIDKPIIVTKGSEYINPDHTAVHMASVTNATAFDLASNEDMVLVWAGRIGAQTAFNSRLLTTANNGAASIELIRSDASENAVFRFDNGTADEAVLTGVDIDNYKPVVIIGALNVAEQLIEIHWYYADGTGGYNSAAVSPPFNAIDLNGQARIMRNVAGTFITGGVSKGTAIAPTEAEAASIARKIFDATHVLVNQKQFEVRPVAYQRTKVIATMDANQIIAGGQTGTMIMGYVSDAENNPVAGADVYWRKARDVESVFRDVSQSVSPATPGQSNDTGLVTTDAGGRFSVGPFISANEPGYWFVALECQDGGDVVYWYEYLPGTNVLDSVTLQPYTSVQQGFSSDIFTDYYATPAYPVTFDEENYLDAPTGHVPDWAPPAWYPIKRYKQYQMGLLGSGHYDFDKSATPDYDDAIEA